MVEEDKYGKKRSLELCNCENCGIEFKRRTETNQRFCSRKCTGEYSRKRIEVKCATCETPLFRSLSRLARSRSGFYFCNRECKEKAQCIGGLSEIQPDHYGTGTSAYSRIAKSEHGAKCADCENSFEPILEVHHKNGDRNNNTSENLEVLCPTHHKLRHMRFIKGAWTFNTRFLTDRDRLEELKRLMGP